MNKEEALKLADVMIGGRFTSTGVAIYDATSSELLAFANACEKIGMEKAAKICHSRYMGDNNREDAEALRCEVDILKAI